MPCSTQDNVLNIQFGSVVNAFTKQTHFYFCLSTLHNDEILLGSLGDICIR